MFMSSPKVTVYLGLLGIFLSSCLGRGGNLLEYCYDFFFRFTPGTVRNKIFSIPIMLLDDTLIVFFSTLIAGLRKIIGCAECDDHQAICYCILKQNSNRLFICR